MFIIYQVDPRNAVSKNLPVYEALIGLLQTQQASIQVQVMLKLGQH